MLSCSLDPDQDLQSGSKLFTWYDVCCNIKGGGLCPSCKIHGGDFVPVYKNEQGGFCPGGILSYTLVISYIIPANHIPVVQIGYTTGIIILH